MNYRVAVFVGLQLAAMAALWAGTRAGNDDVVTTTASDTITLMTLNTQVFLSSAAGLSSNLEAVADLVRAQNVDIIALQESDANTVMGGNQNGVWWLARELGYHYYHGAPSKYYTTGTALLSRWPISDAGWRILPAQASMARGATWARVATPRGMVRVVVAHLQWAAEPGDPETYTTDHVAQTEAIIDLAGTGEPVVVMGDFNAGPGYHGAAYGMLQQRFADAWVEAGNEEAAVAGYTWPAAKPSMRIDHIFLSRGPFRVVPGSTVIGNGGSDHLAVITKVVLEK